VNYIIKRLVIAVVMFVAVLALLWIFIGFIPGDPIQALMAQQTMEDPAALELVRQQYMREYGFDKPWYAQLWDFFIGIFKGKWGKSISTVHLGTDVFDLIKIYFPHTLELAIIPIIIVNVAAAKLGKYTATHRGEKGDHVVRGTSIMMVSLPAFWVALIMQYLFRAVVPNLVLFFLVTFIGALIVFILSKKFVNKNWRYKKPLFSVLFVLLFFSMFLLILAIIDLPVVGLFSTKYMARNVPTVTGFRLIDTLLSNQLDLFIDTLLHLILPSIVFFMTVFGHTLRFSRSCMLDVIEEDYIRTARAKGSSEKDVINKHAYRNALIPYSTFVGFNVGFFVAGAAYIEYIFDFNGIGKAMVNAFQELDYFMIRGCVVIFCLIVIIINIVVDVLYAVLDPRIVYR
jgi:dipeptide transport system permease protein